MLPATFVQSIGFWVALLLLAYLHIKWIRMFLYNATDLDGFRQAVKESFYWLYLGHKGHWIAGGLVCFSAARAILIFATTSYTLTDDCVSIRYGVGDFECPAGVFKSFTDTMALPLILDVDFTQNPIQLIWNTGHIYIKTTDKVSRTRYVHAPQALRDEIIQKSGVKNARLYSNTR
jgi:hypothetical protein